MRARGAEIWLVIAYFTQVAVVAAQLAGTTHQGLSQSQRNTSNANQPGASGCLLIWSNSSTGCVSRLLCRFLASLHWPEKRQRAKQHSWCLLKKCSLVTVLSSNYAKTVSLLPSFKVGGEHIITALTSQTELPFSHGMLLRLFASFDYKNDSQVFEDNCRQGHC